MTAKVLALLDGSIYSHSVCDHAAWISTRTGLAVEMMHVLGRRETASARDLSGAIALGARTALLEELSALDEQRARLAVQKGRAILEDAKALLDEAGVKEVSVHLRHGDLLEAVTEREPGAELILIGKRGEGADFAKGHLGSNLERVMRATAKPVFIAARAFRPIRRILLAFDGGASALRAVEHLASQKLYAGLAVEIVTAGAPGHQLQQSLGDARGALAAADLQADTRVLSGPPEVALGKLVEEEGFDLVVMGASGHSRLRSMLVGSTTTEMIRTCKASIMLVK